MTVEPIGVAPNIQVPAGWIAVDAGGPASARGVCSRPRSGPLARVGAKRERHVGPALAPSAPTPAAAEWQVPGEQLTNFVSTCRLVSHRHKRPRGGLACVDAAGYSSSSCIGAATRAVLLAALAGRLNDAIMLMVARWRRGEGDELLSPLVMPALAVSRPLPPVS